jgi:ABC-type microcin C transport system permease subunit YejE
VKQTANKAFPLLLLLLVLAYVVKEPAQAAHTFSALWDWLGHVGTAFGRFLDSL